MSQTDRLNILRLVCKSGVGIGLARNEREFCRMWLGRDQNYLDILEAYHLQPDTPTMKKCAERLEWVADEFQFSGIDPLVKYAPRVHSMAEVIYRRLEIDQH